MGRGVLKKECIQMKKIKTLGFILVFALLFISGSRLTFASAKIDVSKASDGLVRYEYTGDLKAKEIFAMLELPGVDKVTPQMFVSPSVLILSMGNGTYVCKVLEKLPNGKGMSVAPGGEATDAVLSKAPDEKTVFLASTIDADFAASTVCIPNYKKLTEGMTDAQKIEAIYEEVVNNYTYDYDKKDAVLKKTLKNYLPVIDVIYNVKKGICYDYSAVLAGALRSQGIPVKLVKGVAADVGDAKHAWNEIWTGEKWVVVDTTFDAAYAEAGAAYTFEKDRSKYKAQSYH